MTGAKPAPGWMVDLSLIAIALIWGSTFILVKQRAGRRFDAAVPDPAFRLAATAALAFDLSQRIARSSIRARSAWRPDRGRVACSAATCCKPSVSNTRQPSKTGFITGLYIPLVPLFSSLIYKHIPQLAEIVGSS